MKVTPPLAHVAHLLVQLSGLRGNIQPGMTLSVGVDVGGGSGGGGSNQPPTNGEIDAGGAC
jgi:hypothetical protein